MTIASIIFCTLMTLVQNRVMISKNNNSNEQILPTFIQFVFLVHKKAPFFL